MQQRCATFSAGRNARNAPAADARRDDYLDFDDLKERPTVPPFRPGDLEKAEAEPILVLPSAPSGVGKFVPGAKARYEQTVEALQVEHRQKMQEYMLRENDRKAALANALAERDAEVARIEAAAAAQHEEVNQFHGQFEQGDPSAIVEYFSLVLDRSGYPAGFPKQHRMAFVPKSKQLVVEYELPTFEAAVPTVKTYRYVRARDAIDQTARPAAGALGVFIGLSERWVARCAGSLRPLRGCGPRVGARVGLSVSNRRMRCRRGGRPRDRTSKRHCHLPVYGCRGLDAAAEGSWGCLRRGAG